MNYKIKIDINDVPLQITSLTEVITNGVVKMLLEKENGDLIDNVVTFLKYQRFGKYDKDVEQALLDKVNKILEEQ